MTMLSHHIAYSYNFIPYQFGGSHTLKRCAMLTKKALHNHCPPPFFPRRPSQSLLYCYYAECIRIIMNQHCNSMEYANVA